MTALAEAILSNATNVTGPIGKEEKARIRAFLDGPSQATWDDIHGLIIRRRRFKTIWQAVLDVDPTFPASVRTTGGKRWARIPSPFVVLRAIQRATESE